MKKIIALLLSVMIVFAALSALCVNAAAVSSPGNTVEVVSNVKGGGGNITPSANYKPGQSPKYYITPDPGYIVKQVWIDGVPMGPITEFEFANITDDHTVEVEFEKDPNYKPTSTTAAGTTVANTGKTSPDTGSQVDTFVVVSSVVGATLIVAFTAVAVSKKSRKEEN